MDINSLLGPQDGTAAAAAAAAARTARKSHGNTNQSSSSPKAQLPSVPLSPASSSSSRQSNIMTQIRQRATHASQDRNRSSAPLPTHTAQVLASSNGESPITGLNKPSPQANSPSSTQAYIQQQRYNAPVYSPRPNGSTERMDFLADVASAQHAQRQNSIHTTSMRSPGVREASHSSPSTSRHTPPSVSRRNSMLKSPVDIATNGAPIPTIAPKAFKSSSVSRQDLTSLNTLSAQLEKNSYVHETHVQLISLLHQGFVDYVTSSHQTGHGLQNPHDYELLKDLRQAREAMDTRFTVGEEIWLDWIKDESILARTTEERVAVMELCQKAVQTEQGSSKLWRLYGDWVYYLYKSAHGLDDQPYEENTFESASIVGRVLEARPWSDEDKAVGQEVFRWDSQFEVWVQGQKATQWHINDSNLVWDPYIRILLHDQERRPSEEKVNHIANLFTSRLRQAHATWDETFQTYSQFISQYRSADYERIMVSTSKQAPNLKRQYELRQDFESKLENAIENGDKNAQWYVMTEYLEWEAAQNRKKNAPVDGFELYVGLSERANLLFPTDAELWEDHVDLKMENPDANHHSLLDVTQRATRHCPWSGGLWTKHIYALEISGTSFEELEQAQIHATRSGLLEEVGGLDELIKVYTAWCGVLRRRAFQPGSTEDDRDVAEMGIRSAIENVKTIGEQKYGRDFKGDPHFRVERIYNKFLAQTRRDDDCRRSWAKLTITHGDYVDFWTSYYLWEMTTWGKDLERAAHNKQPLPPPDFATSVLQRAMRSPNLDWPEKIIEMYLHHCAQNETVSKLQQAHVEARRVMKQVAKRRAKEAEAATQAAAAQPNEYSQTAASSVTNDLVDDSTHVGKRKREGDHDRTAANASNAKRSKGQAGADVSGYEKPVRQQAQSQHVQQIDDQAYQTAEPVVEPTTQSTASHLSDQPTTRDRENTTITVRNLPSNVKETKVRQIFRDCGNIVNIHLRVEEEGSSATAMIEFESADDVLAAETKNYRNVDGHSIEVQIATGTTLWVANYPPEADGYYIRGLFKQFGDIVEIRFPSLKYNTHRRFCYVQFLTAIQAQAATQLDGKALPGNLILSAKISDPAAKKSRTGAAYEARELHIANVDWNATEEDVKDAFKSYGTIEQVRIPRNMAGKSKGTAFVVFASKDEAEAALEMNLKEFKSRVLSVSIARSNAKGSKRQATTIIKAASPDPEQTSQGHQSMDVEGASPGSSNLHAQHSGSKDYLARTLLLKNVPDTVNDARIRVLLEAHGLLKKITLKPEKREAMVEFEHLSDVGKAELAMQGYEIIKGTFLDVGRLESDGNGAGSRLRNTDQNVRPFAPVRRPNQAGAAGGRGGGRPGLGFRRKLPQSNGTSVNGQDSSRLVDGKEEAGAKPRSNADFRAFLSQGSK